MIWLGCVFIRLMMWIFFFLVLERTFGVRVDLVYDVILLMNMVL